jgi:hypothetical protein
MEDLTDPYPAHSSDTKAEIELTGLGRDELVSTVEKTLAQLLLSDQPQLTVTFAVAKKQTIIRLLKECVLGGPYFHTSVTHIFSSHGLEYENIGRPIIIKLPHTPSS